MKRRMVIGTMLAQALSILENARHDTGFANFVSPAYLKN
jgi:hypothetical protein